MVHNSLGRLPDTVTKTRTMSTSAPDFSQYADTVTSICTKRQNDDRLHPMTTNDVHSCLEGFCDRFPRNQRTYRALSLACAYDRAPLGIEASIGARLNYGPFAPLLVWFDEDSMHLFPVPLDQLPKETVDAWIGIAAVSDLHPLVAARLADLLCVCRPADAHPWRLRAIEAYAQVSICQRIDSEERDFALKRLDNLKHPPALARGTVGSRHDESN